MNQTLSLWCFIGTYFTLMNESSPVYILLVRCLILLVVIFGFFFLHIPNSTKTYHLLNTKQDSKNKKTEEGIVVSMKPGEYLINLVKNESAIILCYSNCSCICLTVVLKLSCLSKTFSFINIFWEKIVKLLKFMQHNQKII